ncbi:UvrD-helicase domain-containing protein [Cruoricaptor ignavus]|uniref:UvrD-helicase domain-containing protein n=1 Tax=Cruoricaptor ignavus TaxID=1118202 RepID=UPI00370DD873
MDRPKNYTAITASAGSGKTYALVQRILMICFSQPKNEQAIGRILALTFTNKAANEMKERILSWLKGFTKDNYKDNRDLINIQEALAARGIRVPMEELHARSRALLDYILHHYSTLNIGTIDKFNARLVRSFSYELGLPSQFNIEINTEPFLVQAVERMLDEIGIDGQLSKAFMDFVHYNLDNEKRVNLNKVLYEGAKEFASDIHYEDLKGNEGFDWARYEASKERLRKEIAEHEAQVSIIAEKSLRMIKDEGITPGDFCDKSRGLGYFFINVLLFVEGKKKDFPLSDNEENKIATFRKGTTSNKPEIIAAVESLVEPLIENRMAIIQNYILSLKKKHILKQLLPLKVNKEIQDQLRMIEDENDVLLLSRFNVLIGENLRNEPSAFIYEKVGTQFSHFFIDEFQDTSKMQWQNMLPLKDNAVSETTNSFTLVGDPKQSIYRWRGGDSSLMLNIINGREESPVEVSVETLAENYRSAKNLVDFNNELYEFLSTKNLQADHCELFSLKARQTPRKDIPGRVRVFTTPYSQPKAPYIEAVTDQMHRSIQELVERGFNLKDITILFRNNEDIRSFSILLGSKKIVRNGNEEFIKTISDKGITLNLSLTLRALMDFLRWECSPENNQHAVTMLYWLNRLGRIDISDFTAEMQEMLALGSRNAKLGWMQERFGVKLHRAGSTPLNLYNYIEGYLHEFSVEGKETDFLLSFLETLYGFSQNSAATLKDFVAYWEEEASKISVQASESIEAVKMMTVHSAKGLEFPVVFLPVRHANKDSKFSEWLPMEGFEGLKSVNIEQFKKELAIYDREVAEFNSENNYKNRIDRYCVQYVATTRPVEQLFLFLEKPSSKSVPTEILEFAQQKNPEGLDEFDIYPEEGDSYSKLTGKAEARPETMRITQLSARGEARGNIKIATPSRKYQNTRAEVRNGIFTHEILSQINSAEDVERILRKYLLKGEISTEERYEVRARILKIINDENFGQYFRKGLKIINEKDIMISGADGAKLYRPDRLIETGEGIFIIDFKTGAPKDSHRLQVEKYRNILLQLGKKVAGTELIYI